MKIEVSKIKKVAVNLILLFVLLFGFEARADFSLFDKSEIAKCRKLYNKKTQKDWDKAYESTCGELARNGNGEAQYYIGMMIKSSPKIPDYKAQAYSLFYAANENGEVRAKKEMEAIEKVMSKNDLAISYIILANEYDESFTKSKVIKKSNKKALELTKLSAEFGLPSAQEGLCVSYALGSDGSFKFEKDYIQAYKWCFIAHLDPKIRNNEKSQKVFAKLKSLMTKDQINEGDKLGKEWIKNHYDVIENLNKNNDSEILNSELLYNKPKK